MAKRLQMLVAGCDPAERRLPILLTFRSVPHAGPMLMTRIGLPWITVSLQWVGVALVLTVSLTAWIFRSTAPAASLGLIGSLVGGYVGFLLGASNGPRNAPAAAAVAATAGLVVFGIAGLLGTSSPATRRSLNRAAIWVLLGGVLSAGLLTLSLLDACPLYVTFAGYCSYGGDDVLGGWVSGVVGLYLFDVLVVSGILVGCAERA